MTVLTGVIVWAIIIALGILAGVLVYRDADRELQSRIDWTLREGGE